MPIMVQIVPTNDHDPVVTLVTSETYYVENDPPQPVLPDIIITDGDEYCENDQLSAARVQVDTLAKDCDGDNLMVNSYLLSLSHRAALLMSFIISCFSSYVQLEIGEIEIESISSSGPCPALTNVSTPDLVWYICRTVGGELQLVISGEAVRAVYQQLLRTVAYSNNALEPDKQYPMKTISVCHMCISLDFSTVM